MICICLTLVFKIDYSIAECENKTPIKYTNTLQVFRSTIEHDIAKLLDVTPSKRVGGIVYFIVKSRMQIEAFLKSEFRLLWFNHMAMIYGKQIPPASFQWDLKTINCNVTAHSRNSTVCEITYMA